MAPPRIGRDTDRPNTDSNQKDRRPDSLRSKCQREKMPSGDVYYAPAPHTAIVEQDTRLLDFSPQQEHDELMAHVSKVMAPQAGD